MESKGQISTILKLDHSDRVDCMSDVKIRIAYFCYKTNIIKHLMTR